MFPVRARPVPSDAATERVFSIPWARPIAGERHAAAAARATHRHLFTCTLLA
jgi:hypothetical protein